MISRRGLFKFVGGALATGVFPGLMSAKDNTKRAIAVLPKADADVAKIHVRCRHITTSFRGRTVGEARKALTEEIFIPKGAIAIVRANLMRRMAVVPDDFILRHGDQIDFLVFPDDQEIFDYAVKMSMK